MKELKEYIPIFVSMFVSIAALMVLLAMIEPNAFSLVPGAVPDSLLAVDSVLAPQSDSSSTTVEQKSVTHEELSKQDSVSRTVAPQPDTSRISVVASAEDGFKFHPYPSPGPDTLAAGERKKMAQIFESMDPESAARILLNMSDTAVKQVLTSMKKRQSAKILAVLDPAKAARILKEKP